METSKAPSVEEGIRALKERGHTPTGLVVVGGNGSSGSQTRFGTGIFKTVTNVEVDWDTIIPKAFSPQTYTEGEKKYFREQADLLEDINNQFSEPLPAKFVPYPSSRYPNLELLTRKLDQDLKKRKKEELEGKTNITEIDENFRRLASNRMLPLCAESTSLQNGTIKSHYIYGIEYPYEKIAVDDDRYRLQFVDVEKGLINKEDILPSEREVWMLKLESELGEKLKVMDQINRPAITFILLKPEEYKLAQNCVHGIPAIHMYMKINGDMANPGDPKHIPFIESARTESAARLRKSILKNIEEGDETDIIVQMTIDKAMQRQASDIHIDPIRDKRGGTGRILLRVDGEREIAFDDLSIPQTEAVITSIINKSGQQHPDKRNSFDGEVYCTELGYPNHLLRLSTVPRGEYFDPAKNQRIQIESLVARIAETYGESKRLKDLEFPKYIENGLRELADENNGIILFLGATGQGKTTTWAAIEHEIDHIKNRSITFENPIEREIEGVMHTPENKKAGYDLQKFSETAMRQDPDIISISEIRKYEAALQAINASLTGHLVFSTLHTERAEQAFKRLMNLAPSTEIGDFQTSLATTLIALQAQKLAKKLCQKCRERYDAREDLASILEYKLDDLKKQLPDPIYMYRPCGRTQSGDPCKECDGIGEKGRIVVPQFLPITEEISRLIDSGVKEESAYLEAGRKVGLLTFSELSILTALDGLASLKALKVVATPRVMRRERENLIYMIKAYNPAWRTCEHNPFIRA